MEPHSLDWWITVIGLPLTLAGLWLGWFAMTGLAPKIHVVPDQRAESQRTLYLRLISKPKQSWVHRLLKPLTAAVNVSVSVSIFDEEKSSFIVKDWGLPATSQEVCASLMPHDHAWITFADEHPYDPSIIILGTSANAEIDTPPLRSGEYSAVFFIRHDHHEQQHTLRFKVQDYPASLMWLS